MREEKGKTGDLGVESALIDAELFMKYKATERAINRLREAIDKTPHSLRLREALRDMAKSCNYPSEAARQGLALARIYIDREDFDSAYDRLIEAKTLDPRINIASGLDAIRKAKRPDLQPGEASTKKRAATFAGDIALVSIFDAIQVIENSRLTGVLSIDAEVQEGKIFFNAGRIVDAESGNVNGEEGFRKICEMTSGLFDFVRSEQGYPVNIVAASNTNLILDSLRKVDEDNKEEEEDEDEFFN
jgi:tetratricopeptide (TPR) repeat protein